MTLLPMLRRRWYIVVPLAALTALLAFLVGSNAPTSYQASGIVMIADPQLDPSRSALRGIDIPSIVADANSDALRAETVAAGGSEQYAVRAVGPRRLQVVASGATESATKTVEVTLRHLERAIAQAQIGDDRDPEERVRTRLLIEVPDLGSDRGGAEGLAPATEVVGTLVLQDPSDDAENPFGRRNSARLLTVAVNSESERARIADLLGQDVGFGLRTYDDRAGMLQIVLRGPHPAETLAGFPILVDVLGTELEDRQVAAAVPTGQRRFLEVLAAPQHAVDTSSTWHFPTILTVLGGLVLAAASAAAADRWLGGEDHDDPGQHSEWPSPPTSRNEPDPRRFPVHR